jgi:hypothetical protein
VQDGPDLAAQPLAGALGEAETALLDVAGNGSRPAASSSLSARTSA